jgi:hypothetical protein
VTHLVDNAPLRTAVAAFAAQPEQRTYTDVLRAALQGELLLDVTGSPIETDESGALSVGSTLRFASGKGPDDAPALFAFTSQAEVLRAHPDDPGAVQALGQPAIGLLQFAVSQDFGWVYIDPLGPTCGLTVADLRYVLGSQRNDAARAALGAPSPRQAVIDALALGGVLVLAVDETGERVRTATAENGDGDAAGAEYALAFTSSAEVAARFPGDKFRTVSVANVIDNVLGGSYAGLILNQAGPRLSLTRDELAGIRDRLPAETA